jgi:hypothetical protein
MTMTPEVVAERLTQFREALDALHDAMPSRSHECGKLESVVGRELDDMLDAVELVLAELSEPLPLFVNYSTFTGHPSQVAA